MSPIVLYLIIAAVVFFTVMIGRSLDQRQSNDKVTWKTGVVGWKTVQQSVILGLIAGPIVWLIKGGSEELWFCIICMMAAPFIVDLMRPTVTFHNDMPKPVASALAVRINRLNLAGVIVGIVLLGFLVAFSAGAFALPTPSGEPCKVCNQP